MLLVVETITWKPHIETAMEIALQHRELGERVVYYNVRDGLPACEDRSVIHWLVDLPSIRVKRAHRLLQERAGIEHECTRFRLLDRRRAQRWAGELLSDVNSTAELLRISYKGFADIGWGVLSSAVSMCSDSTLAYPRDRALISRLLAASILVYDETRRLIELFQPDTILLFNGRYATTRAVIRAAEYAGTQWLVHERGCDKDHYWIGDCMPHDVDRLQGRVRNAWRVALADAGHAFYLGRRERVERQWHSYTKNQKRGKLPAPMEQAGEWVTFFTSSDDEMVAISDQLNNPAFPTQFDAVRAVAEAMEAFPHLNLCVRVHPHVARKSPADRRRWENLHFPGTLLIGPGEDIDSYAVMDRSRIVCTYGSTMGIEATYWGRPSLLLSRSAYDRLGVCAEARSVSEIIEFLENPVTFSSDNALPYGAYQQTYGELYRFYRPESLHRGHILGESLDDAPLVRLLQRLATSSR